jgi:hypothetical protein
MGAQITAITGLQNLTNLQDFRADYNALETIDLSGLTNLTYLDVSDCDELGSTGLKSINVSRCTALESLYIDDNDFSAGFPDLSSCTSLQYFDADQCGISGSLNLSNLPALQGFDLYGNGQLTEVIISSTQPLGDGGRNLNFSACSLTQTSVDNILQQLASGSVSDSYVNLQSDGGNNSRPSIVGVQAIRTLYSRLWNWDVENYSTALNITITHETELDATNDIGNPIGGHGFIMMDDLLEVGTNVYADANLIIAKEDGWFGNPSNSTLYLVSGSNGLIVSSSLLV